MTRPIKFRAWDKRDKEMFTPSELLFSKEYGIDIARPNVLGIDDWRDATLMQFTGLLDKNGKEIYEGDILLANKAWFELASNVGIVGSSGEKFVVHDASWDNWDFIQNRTTEVIGNIYENPDLI